MERNSKATIVILNFNGKHLLEKFLRSIVNHSKGYDIVIVDNCSTDASIEFITQKYPNIKCITLPENLGFAEGYNTVLKKVKSEYYILLNSDVEVTQGWIQPIIELLDSNNQIAACQPKILSYNNKAYFEYAGAAGGFIDTLGFPFCRGRIFSTIEQDHSQYNDNTEIFWATGSCMVIRSKIFHKLGGFDPFFFTYFEEIDLCWRIKKEGLKIYFCSGSTVYHLGSGTIGDDNPKKTFFKIRNRLLMMYKNTSSNKKIIYIIILDLLLATKELLTLRFKHCIAIIKAHLSFFKHKKLYTRPLNTSNTKHIYKRSIVYDFFIRKKKKFTELLESNFS